MSLTKKFFHQVSEIPLVSIFLLVILSPIFLAAQISDMIKNKALNHEIDRLKEIVKMVIPKENKIIGQIREIKNSNLPIEAKIQITNHLISVFKKCHTNNRAANEILKHLKQIAILLTKQLH